MQKLSQNQLNYDIGAIKVLHGRLGHDLAKSLSFHTGGIDFLRQLNKLNILVGNYLGILEGYEILGDETVTEYYNVLSMYEIERIIDDCYRIMNKYVY